MVKICRVCGVGKETHAFVKNSRRADGYDSRCLECDRAYKHAKVMEREAEVRANSKRWREENAETIRLRKHQDYLKRKETILAKNKQYYEQNKEAFLKQAHAYRLTHAEQKKQWDKEYLQKNRERVAAYKKQYRLDHKEENREEVRAYMRKRRQIDTSYRIRLNLSHRICRAVKYSGKSAATRELVGCSLTELRLYLEKRFAPGMSWENYGKDGWHIDHIRPCASFDLSDPEQQKQCFHYTNLQPLWALDNIRKGAKWDGPITRVPYSCEDKH